MSNVAKYIDENVCQIIIKKLINNPNKYNRLLVNSTLNSLYIIKVKNEAMIMKISNDYMREKENNKKIMLSSHFPILYKSLIYDKKLFSFYEFQDTKLSNFFKMKYNKNVYVSIMEQIEMFSTLYHEIFNTFNTCAIDNFLFKYTDEEFIMHNNKKIMLEGIKITLFDYEKSLLKTKSSKKIIQDFFLENFPKYISRENMAKYGIKMDTKFINIFRKKLSYKKIDNSHIQQYEYDIFVTDLFYNIFNEWILEKDLIKEFSIYINDNPFNFPYYYPNI
jgi:hypothetical protein